MNTRTIVVTEIEGMGGAERSILALSRWLYEHNLTHQLLAYSDRPGMAAHAQHPLNVVQLQPPPRITTKISTLRRYLTQNPSPYHPLASGYQAAMHLTLARIRGFHTLMHDTPTLFSQPAGTGSLKQRLNRYVSDRITAHGLHSGGRTIVTSEFLKADTLRIFNVHADIARMGGLANPTAFRPRPVTTRLNLFSVSRIEGNKRIDWILNALAALESAPTPLSQRIDWRLDLAGKGAQIEALRQMAATLGIAHRVTFHGYVSDERLEQLYDQAHLFLMPALQGYGIPAIEALHRGIPVLLHRESGVSDILLSTPWAIVMEGNEPAFQPALETAIATVLEGRQLPHPLPPSPTEDDWAERVATLCKWL
jgi:glycosyltransferase involved in cell wall biosynthesis